MAMRFAAYKQKIKAVAARLSLAALVLAMGIGATSAIFHPGLLDVMRPSASASVFACKATAGEAMPAASSIASEPQTLMRQSLNNDSAVEEVEILINTAIHRGERWAVQSP